MPAPLSPCAGAIGALPEQEEKHDSHRYPRWIEKGVARNAEEAATEIEKALPEFHDLVEYDVDYTSDDIISTDRQGKKTAAATSPKNCSETRATTERRNRHAQENSPETLALAMDYAAAYEACAAYVQVSKPTIREPDAVYRGSSG